MKITWICIFFVFNANGTGVNRPTEFQMTHIHCFILFYFFFFRFVTVNVCVNFAFLRMREKKKLLINESMQHIFFSLKIKLYATLTIYELFYIVWTMDYRVELFRFFGSEFCSERNACIFAGNQRTSHRHTKKNETDRMKRSIRIKIFGMRSHARARPNFTITSLILCLLYSTNIVCVLCASMIDQKVWRLVSFFNI